MMPSARLRGFLKSSVASENTPAALRAALARNPSPSLGVAGGQDYEVNYTAKKKRTTAKAVRRTVKKVGSSRKKVEKALSRSR